MQTYLEYAELLKAFGDENRLRIMTLLLGGEQCANRMLEELSIRQPTLSHHMKILCESGVVTARKQGKHTYYRICGDGVARARRFLDGLLAGRQMAEEMPEGAPAPAAKAETAPKPAEERSGEKRRAVRDMESYLL